MEPSQEKDNYVKISYLILDVIPTHLRKLFIEKWNDRHPDKIWNSDEESGKHLYNELSERFRNSKTKRIFISKMLTGKEVEWDTTLLTQVFLESGLNLIESCRPEGERNSPLRISEKIDTIRHIRNDYFAHLPSISYSSKDFADALMSIKSIARKLFGEEVVDEISVLEASQIERGMSETADKMLQQELNCLRDALKAKYKLLYQKHEIHKINCNQRIVLEEVDIERFAVRLTIGNTIPPLKTYRRETERYLHSLKGMKVSDIKLSELIDINNRVTFIRGIAGMGKSVLVKQLTYKWADGQLFQDFDICFTFECRELNDFVVGYGNSVEKYKLISEFLKWNFNFNARSAKDILFIVDGLDELYDINTNDSIIFQLLEKSRYTESKIIVTARPHIEEKLSRLGQTVGGLRMVEIQGLNEEQIKEYVSKFASNDDDVIAKLNRAKHSPENSLQLIHVPQFLNTFCCAAILSDGKAIHNEAELYCWTFYLLIKQHAEKDGPSEKTIPSLFKEYSNEFMVLCKVCHELLNRNSIIFEGEVELKFFDIVKGKEFLKGLFADVSDNMRIRKQFKHLTLMEFLSAVYVCTTKNLTESTKEILENELYQVLYFNCQLISGLTYDGIIKEMFKNATNLQEVDVKLILHNIFEIVRKHLNTVDKSFQLTIKIILSLMNKDVITKKFLLSLVNELKFKNLNTISKDTLSELMNRLMKEFRCSQMELKEVFKSVHFRTLVIHQFHELKYAECLGSVQWIRFEEMNTTITAICKNIGHGCGQCEMVSIWNSNLQDFENEAIVHSILERFEVNSCQMNKKSFINLWQWVASSSVKVLQLWEIECIEDDWWKDVFDIIVNSKERNKSTVGLEELELRRCSKMMPDQLQIMLRRCGVALNTDTQYLDPLPPNDDQCFQESYSPVNPSPSLTTSTCDVNVNFSQPSETFKRAREKTLGIRIRKSGEGNENDAQEHHKRAKYSPTGVVGRQPQMDDMSFPESSDHGKDVDIADKDGKSVQVKINERGGVSSCKTLKLSLDIPQDAVTDEVQLEISNVPAENIPQIPCGYGEFVLSDVVLIRPIGIPFRKPAILSMEHGIADWQELSSMTIKWYDIEKKEWLLLPPSAGKGKQRRGVTSAAFSTTSYFVVVKSLSVDFYTVHKYPSSFLPFGSKYDVKLIFEENTFGDDDVAGELEFKINVFADKAIDELNHFGLHPFSVLHIKNKSLKQPMKPVTVNFPMTEKLRSDEKLLIFQGRNGEIKDITAITKLEIKEKFASAQLGLFGWSMLCKASTEGLVNRDNPHVICDLVQQYTGPAFKVQFAICEAAIMNGKRNYRILCYRDYRSELADNMKREYEDVTNLTEAKLYSNTEVTIKLDGRYQIDNQEQMVKFRFDHSLGVNLTTAFVIKEMPNAKLGSLIISKAEGKIQLAKVLFDPDPL